MHSMRWWQRFLNRPQADKQLDSELRFHIEQHMAENIAAGMSSEEAQRLARLEFGGLDQVKEDVRESHRGHFMETLLQDVRYGLRSLRKSPGYTMVAVITLALGIGANTAIFSMVDSILLRPLPIHNPQEVVFLRFPRDATHFDPAFSVAEFREIRDQTHGIFSDVNGMVLGGISGQAGRSDGLTVNGVTRPAQALFVTGNFFQMLGIRPYLGRFILPSEGNAPGSDPVVVLSYRYWKKRFNGDPSLLNKTALMNGRPVTIVGIGPTDFLGPTPLIEMEVYLPLGMMTVEAGGNTGAFTNPVQRELLVVGRLAPGVTIEHANAELAALGPRLVKEYPRPGVSAALHAKLLKPPGLVDGPNPLPTLAALFLTLSGLVLALACLNVANLSLVRAAGRNREMAVRAALGGGRGRLIRLLLTETILLGLFGAVGGMVVGEFALRAIRAAATITEFPLVVDFPFNGRVFVYALAIAVLAGAIVGIVPAFRAASRNLNNTLHEGGRGSTGRSQRTRTVLVATQVGGALALLIVAGLFVRSLRSAQHSDLGFDRGNILNVKLDPGEIGYAQVQTVEFYNQLLARVRALPGVECASMAMAVPMDDFQSDEITIPGYVPRPGEQLHPDYDAVSTGYFDTMKIPVLQGRDFAPSDTDSSPRVALINQTMAQRFWPQGNPIGRSFKRNLDKDRTIEVIGVVKDSRTEDVYSPYNPTFYVPISQAYTPSQTLQIRTQGPPQEIAPEALAIVREIAPAAPVLSVRTMSDAITKSPDGLMIFNLGADLTAALGLLGLVLAVIGIYGVMAYAVGQKTQEIGVRLALGAQRKSILWMVSRQGLAIVGAGLAVGLLAALAVGRLMGDFLVGIRPTDPITFMTVSLILTVAGFAACVIPARRATRIDPMIALRHE